MKSTKVQTLGGAAARAQKNFLITIDMYTYMYAYAYAYMYTACESRRITYILRVTESMRTTERERELARGSKSSLLYTVLDSV